MFSYPPLYPENRILYFCVFGADSGLCSLKLLTENVSCSHSLTAGESVCIHFDRSQYVHGTWNMQHFCVYTFGTRGPSRMSILPLWSFFIILILLLGPLSCHVFFHNCYVCFLLFSPSDYYFSTFAAL